MPERKRRENILKNDICGFFFKKKERERERESSWKKYQKKNIKKGSCKKEGGREQFGEMSTSSFGLVASGFFSAGTSAFFSGIVKLYLNEMVPVKKNTPYEAADRLWGAKFPTLKR